MAALQLRPKLRTLHNPSLVNLFSTFPTPSDPTPVDQSPSSTSPHPAQSQSQSQSQSALSSDDWRETMLAMLRPLQEREREEERKRDEERKRAEGETLSQSALSSAPSRSVTAKADENSANAESGPGKVGGRLTFEAIRESVRRLRFRPSSSPGTAQKEGRSAHPMSLSKYQNSFKLKPSTESDPVIGGTGMLPASVFGKERERKGTEGETMATKTEFVKNLKTYTPKELGKKLMELPPEGRFLGKLNERPVKLREMEEKETESNIGGVHMRDLRESLMTLKKSNDENAMKSSTMGKGKEKNVANKQFRWSKPKHTLLLEILADEAAKGNKPSNTFKPASFALVAKSISEKFGVECVPDHVDNRLRTIKSMWNIIGTLRKKSGFGWDENLRMITCDKKVYDEEVMANPKHEQYLNKKIEMYDEMAIVVGKDMVTGSFAKSFNDVVQYDNVLDLDLDFDDVSSKGKDVASSNSGSNKRSHRKISRDDSGDSYNFIAEKLVDIALALQTLNKEVDTDHLYQEVMKVEGHDEFMLASAFDYLNRDVREARGFLVKNAKLRKFWLDSFSKNHGN